MNRKTKKVLVQDIARICGTTVRMMPIRLRSWLMNNKHDASWSLHVAHWCIDDTTEWTHTCAYKVTNGRLNMSCHPEYALNNPMLTIYYSYDEIRDWTYEALHN